MLISIKFSCLHLKTQLARNEWPSKISSSVSRSVESKGYKPHFVIFIWNTQLTNGPVKYLPIIAWLVNQCIIQVELFFIIRVEIFGCKSTEKRIRVNNIIDYIGNSKEEVMNKFLHTWRLFPLNMLWAIILISQIRIQHKLCW